MRQSGKAPLDIINGPLMDGMQEVGRLFNANELIVAEVLQSAEAMKAAVSHLEQFMEKATDSRKGKVILATVKGDVHDIGKNLVEIILSNNGYEVVNLGIKVPPERLVEAYEEHRPDLIGLSGLLVKSAQQMVTTAQDLTARGVTAPMLVGGAALSQKFTDHRIAPAYGGLVVYAVDAMRGLALADRILSGESERERARRRSRGRGGTATALRRRRARRPRARSPRRPCGAKRSRRAQPLAAPDAAEHVLPRARPRRRSGITSTRTCSTRSIWACAGSYWKLKEAGDPRLAELEAVVERVKASGGIRARAMYRYFEAYSEGNSIHVLDGGREAAVFHFPRQAAGERLCLADFVAPREVRARHDRAPHHDGGRGRARPRRGPEDRRASTCSATPSRRSPSRRRKPPRSGCIGSCAPAGASPIRRALTLTDLFQSRYQGKRYSFGYPACPELSDQETLFRLLDGRKIGVELTEGFMMDPEASVSAVVVHHPQARYFAV